MTDLRTLLIQQGYAPLAAKLLAESYIAPAGASEGAVEARLNVYAGNYYMQCLANALSCYGFNLNRFDMPAKDMHLARQLAGGMLGNVPLDNAYVARLLELMVIALRKRHLRQPMRWQELYDYEFRAPDGSLLRGADMVRALLKSNAMHNGCRAVHYAHHFQHMQYHTYSMHEVMEACLQNAQHLPLVGLTRYGMLVQLHAVEQIRLLPRALKYLTPLRFFNVFHMNAHRKLRTVLLGLLRYMAQPHTDLRVMQDMQRALRAATPYPAMYPEDWQRFIEQLEIWLESLTTPYAAPHARLA